MMGIPYSVKANKGDIGDNLNLTLGGYHNL